MPGDLRPVCVDSGARADGRACRPAPRIDSRDASAAGKGSRAVWFGDDFVDTPVYDGGVLGPGAAFDGPALIEEPFTVVVVPPGAGARLDDHGNYDIRLG